MRYFRFTASPGSPLVQQDGTVTVRLRFALTGQMIYATFRDGDWIAVDDTEMGAWGGPTDFLMDIDVGASPYKLFQEGAPQVADLGAIATMADKLVPYDSSTQAQPIVWPSIAVTQGP